MGTRWDRSRMLWDRALQSIGGGAASSLRASMRPHQLYLTDGAGARLTDVDGRSYVDYVLGWGPMLLGHAHPAVTRAAHRQLDRGVLFGGGNPNEVEAAERFLSAQGWARRLLWTNTGTEAVQVAVRLARAKTGRSLVLKLVGGYHGWHDTVLASLYGRSDDGAALPQSLGQPPSSIADLRVGLYNDLESCAQVFSSEPGRIAAVLIDPTASNGGCVVPEPGFLEGLRRLCDQHGALLIFDEVVSGLRLGLAGATGRFDVTPDLATYGKAIGAGFPIAAVAGRADVIDMVSAGAVHSGTFNGNPLGTAAVKATLDVLSAPGAIEKLDRNAESLAKGISKAAREAGHQIAVHSLGATVFAAPGLNVYHGPADYPRADWEYWNERLIPAMLAEGIYLLPYGRLFLSTEHSVDIVAETSAAFARVLAGLQAPNKK